MKIWITGGRGFVGNALKKVCRAEEIDCITTGRDLVDITSPQQIKRFLRSPQGAGITHVINCAAYTNVDLAEQDVEEAFLVNAKAPEYLGHIAHTHDLQMIHLSTDYVFGTDGKQPFKETDRCDPASVYAKTKLEGESRLLEAFPQACIVRTSWVFGPGGKNFVSAFLDKIQREEAVYAVTDQKNRATYVHDLAQTLLALAGQSGIFHFANQGETSRFEIAQKMVQFVKDRGMNIACKEVIGVESSAFPQIAKRPVYSALDTCKIEALLGLTPRPWEEALKEFIYAL
jgi:dTDP-4-dehydrorhamnose reductase